MDKRIIEDVARNAARSTLTVIDLTNKSISVYLDQGSFGEAVAEEEVAIDPFKLTAGLVTIGAHFCGLDEEETVELLTKLAKDGVFQPPPKLDKPA